MTDKWPATPILTDEGEQSMFDFVPFACSRGEMVDMDGKPRRVGEFLSFRFPQTPPITVASSAVCRDHETPCFWILFLSHSLPPSLNTGNCKCRSIMVYADTDPPLIFDQIIDVHCFRHTLRLPFPTIILKVSHQFLLFRVY